MIRAVYILSYFELSYLEKSTVPVFCISNLSIKACTMSYNATVFTVMIASPGDVSQERMIVREVLAEWNAIHSGSRKIVLLPAGWESHSSPEMGNSAQSIINEQVLDKCDLLVGVFWTRIGTQTTDFASGTVEEIELHIKAGKPTMLYFSSQPARLDSVDKIQYDELIKFRDSCQSRGLYENYDSLGEFKDKLNRQLQIKLNDHPMFNLTERLTDDHEQSDASLSLKLAELSEEAQRILKEASLNEQGIIHHMVDLKQIIANGKNLIEDQSRRSIAKWEAGLKQLQEKELIIARGYKGEVYEITERGYQVADLLSW